jgi:hypothetical protein
VVDKSTERKYALPKWSWKSLIGDDAIDIITALNPYQDNMGQNQIDYLMEDVMDLPSRDEASDTIGAQKIAAGKDALAQVRIAAPLATPEQPGQQVGQIAQTPPEKTQLHRIKKKKGEVVAIPDNYVLYDPDEDSHEAI